MDEILKLSYIPHMVELLSFRFKYIFLNYKNNLFLKLLPNLIRLGH